jgi:hypothetical protein
VETDPDRIEAILAGAGVGDQYDQWLALIEAEIDSFPMRPYVSVRSFVSGRDLYCVTLSKVPFRDAEPILRVVEHGINFHGCSKSELTGREDVERLCLELAAEAREFYKQCERQGFEEPVID